MPNRLAQESSPYLLQHKDNPIDWMPWGEEAFLRARLEDKPVFLSVGYASCHWCHVMAHESFEDRETALALNSSFICIKVDREERPDVDEAYMTAVQVATGRGGWPMNVFMTPEKKPFFCGTYFPRTSFGGVPGFLTIVTSLAASWRDERDKVEETAADFAEHLRQIMGREMAASQSLPEGRLFDAAVARLAEEFDGEHGGFGQSPKFPPHTAIRFLLDYTGARGDMDEEAPEGADLGQIVSAAGSMAVFTLERMACGGIHDHVGGGFHRYSTDEKWLLPHFEKMLSDNALLLWSYAAAREVVEDPRLRALFDRTAKGIVSWAEREMLSPEGMFYSSIDADSEGEEGLFYTWTMDEVPGRVADLYGFTPEGNYEEEATGQPSGRNILHGCLGEGTEEDLALLLARREERVRPEVDVKSLCSWNGLMISGLAAAGELDVARRCAEAWLARLAEGAPPHQVVDGRSSGEPYLDDFAYLIEGLIDLYEVDRDVRWLNGVELMLPVMLERHQDSDRGGFYYVGSRMEALFVRTKPMMDQAAPSAGAVAARILGRLGLQDSALPHASFLMPWAEKIPSAAETALSALLYWSGRHVQESQAAGAPSETALAFDVDEVRVYLNPREVAVDRDGWGHALVTIALPPGIHINTDQPPARWLTPTSLRVEGVFGEAGFPEGDNDRYKGEVNIPVRLRPKKGTEEFQLTVVFQPCTDRECLPPVERQLAGVLLAVKTP